MSPQTSTTQQIHGQSPTPIRHQPGALKYTQLLLVAFSILLGSGYIARALLAG